MKKILISFACLAGVFGLASYYYISQPTVPPHPTATAPVVAETPGPETVVESAKPKPVDMIKPKMASGDASANKVSAPPAPSSVEGEAFTDAVNALVSPKSTYGQRQAALKQLKDTGRLADAIARLEQDMPNDPKNALYPAVLGEAYLKMCAGSTDLREQAIWAMTADKDFDTALSLDPSNWDARYTKAVAMSYWPASMNKGDEVIQQFTTLIQQQEQETPQPEFAQTYEWLGKQYQKAGQPDAAQQVWQRGAALFPNDPTLQAAIAGPATAQQ